MTGRASVGIARRLRHHGFTEVAAPAELPGDHGRTELMSGEAERARQWAASVYESLLADAGADV